MRVGIALLSLTSAGRGLGLSPRIGSEPLRGDAFGFYAAAREYMASLGRVPAPLAALAVLLVTGAFAVAGRDRARRGRFTWIAVVVPAAALALALTLPIREMAPPGAAVLGWPLLWALAMTPYRAAGLEPAPEAAHVFGVVLSLAALAVTTVATAYLGRFASGARAVGLGAAGLFALWPLVPGLVGGEAAWRNGQWGVDAGLYLYTEPLSTALVTVGAALLLRPGAGDTGRAGAGLALGYATFVKLTNGVVALALVPILAARLGWRRTVPYAAGGLVAAPLVAAYWPKGYVGMFGGSVARSQRPWGLDYVDDAWGRSTVFTPTLLLLLAPLLLAGVVALRHRLALAVLLAPIVLTVAVYSFYDVTYLHPRFLYVTLPFVFVLEAAGAAFVLRAFSSLREVKGSFGGGRSSQRGL